MSLKDVEEKFLDKYVDRELLKSEEESARTLIETQKGLLIQMVFDDVKEEILSKHNFVLSEKDHVQTTNPEKDDYVCEDYVDGYIDGVNRLARRLLGLREGEFNDLLKKRSVRNEP